MDPELLTSRITELVASNPGQMACEEYAAIASELLMRGPCSLLVFGLGKDTDLWADINCRGKTTFLEHDPRWIRFKRAESQAVSMAFADPKTKISVIEVEYKTKVESFGLLRQADPSDLTMQLPPSVRDHRWDVILVDAPPGDGPGRPGRFQSIYEASRLAAPDACVFVHDVHRPIERWFSTRFLGKSIEEILHLGVFGTKAKRPRR